MKLVNRAEACEALGIKPKHLEALVARGDVPFYKLGRLVRFNLDEVAAACRRPQDAA